MPYRSPSGAPEGHGRSFTSGIERVSGVRRQTIGGATPSRRRTPRKGGESPTPGPYQRDIYSAWRRNELMLSTIRSACLAAGLSILALVAFSPAAEAGTYRQYTCKLPDGTPAATDG